MGKILLEAAEQGNWLCLKNLHLMISWLVQLDKMLQSLKPHKEFRLWLTTEPHDNLPDSLIKSCLKVTYEVYAEIFGINIKHS